MNMSRFCSALMRRELAPGTLGPAVLAAIAAGVGGGIVAQQYPDARYGSAMLIVELDRTIAGALVIMAVYRIITRLSADAEEAWLQQLVAAGADRASYVAALLVGVTAALLACYVACAWAFSGVMAIAASTYAPAIRALTTLPMVALMLFAAACFGAAAYGIAGAPAARALATVVLAAPWVITWMALAVRADLPPAWMTRALALQAPPMAVDLSLATAASLFIYTGITFALAVTFGRNRVARL